MRGIEDWQDTSWATSEETETDIFTIGNFTKLWPETCCELSEETSDLYLESQSFQPTIRELQDCYRDQPEVSTSVNTNGCYDQVKQILRVIIYLPCTFLIIVSLIAATETALIYLIYLNYKTEVVKASFQ